MTEIILDFNMLNKFNKLKAKLIKIDRELARLNKERTDLHKKLAAL